jgi:lysozyme family protein
MQHPFDIVTQDYPALLAAMVVKPEKVRLVDQVAHRLLGFVSPHYAPVTAAIGVPAVFIGASFEREGSSDFTKNPAQGWSLHSTSRIIPHNGPFPTWFAAAIAAYKIDGLDKVGAGNWTWEHACYYGEALNGWGYRDYHRMHTPYLWAGTNIQTVGKYRSDGEFDPNEMDEQLGMMPVAVRMAQLEPSLDLPHLKMAIKPPTPTGLATAVGDGDVRSVQTMINQLGATPPIFVDGNYGRETKLAVEQFQNSYGLHVDGIAGPQTITALRRAIAWMPK